jgi:hypothetical protein
MRGQQQQQTVLMKHTYTYTRTRLQSSVFRTFQGWLALSATSPSHGTLQVFPDVKLSNAYLMLRPFFRLKEGMNVGDEETVLKAESWEFGAPPSLGTNTLTGHDSDV